MKYRCKSTLISSLLAGPTGFIQPLCNSCGTKDCTNPIEKTKISILGITKIYRVYCKGSDHNFVIQCEGYLHEEK